MSELTAPHTPRAEHSMRRGGGTPLSSPIASNDISSPSRGQESPFIDSRVMTPPPSTHLPKPSSKSTHARSLSRREYSLASPPATLKTDPPITSGSLFGEIPSPDSVQNMDEGQLRRLVGELLPAFGEARVNAAHAKLQHSLLSIETEEAGKRAAVELEATRREVQVLQEGSPVHRHAFIPGSPQASMQRSLHDALDYIRNLQKENALLHKHLRSSKHIIKQLDEQNAKLEENSQLLRQRIKENRDHLNDLQSSGAISVNGTPLTGNHSPLITRTPKTPAMSSRALHNTNQTPQTHNPIDALLLADQYVNGEANSVPSSPTLTKSKKTQSHHVRGAHSLSSLPTTPSRSRPVTADPSLRVVSRYATNPRASFSAPGTQISHSRGTWAQEDRESTISASEDERDISDKEDLPGSQASQAASSMLRQSLGPRKSNTATTKTPETSKIMQAKLFGQVQKPNSARNKTLKRAHPETGNQPTKSNKKARTAGSGAKRVGLGIQTSPDAR